MYKIKQIPQDFIVIEESSISPKQQGRYAYFRLWKREYTTLRAVEHVAQFLDIPLKDVGFAGTKDKEAITEQLVSVKHGTPKLAENFKRDDMKLTFLGYGDTPLSLGGLKGNRFEIVIRNIDALPTKAGWIINYFDDQRFSTNNVHIGRAMLQGKFDEACKLIDDEAVNSFLEDEPKNYNGALHKLPLKTLQLYVHAYQSHLFNEAVSEYLQCKYNSGELVFLPYSLGKLTSPKQKPENEPFPLIGFGIEYPTKEIETISHRLLKKDDLTERSFVIRAFPELSAEGEMRDMVIDVQDFTMGKLEEDDLNQGKKKCKVMFFLQKGSYATMVVKRITNESM